MALLNVAFPNTSFAISHPLSSSNQGNINVLTKNKLRVPSHAIRGSSFAARCCSSSEQLQRGDFPPSFKFGASTSALQTESYATEGGRGHCPWDFMLGDYPAVHSLVKYQDDVKCLKDMNADVYRFSISWPRILPNGKYTGPESINQEGVKFYHRLIDELLNNGVTPFVTLFHFDLPSALEKEYNGLLSKDFVYDFNQYADLCFDLFGDKVKHWITFNEPSTYCTSGHYKYGMSGEDEPALYPYLAAHHLLLAHAQAVCTYRKRHQGRQGGKIGMSIVTSWLLPYTNSPSDVAAAPRLWDFLVGWFLDPMVYGDYPFSMKTIVRDRLPEFTEEEKYLLRGSYDFIGANYYTSRYAKGLPYSPNDVPESYAKDSYVEMLAESKDGVPIGPQSPAMEFMYSYPQGLLPILENIKNKYNDPQIYITENGYAQLLKGETKKEILNDDERIKFMEDHLKYVRAALRKGVNVDGYFVWALMDNMEVFDYYYNVGFGLYHVDMQKDFERTPKKSAIWYTNFLLGKTAAPVPLLEPVTSTAAASDAAAAAAAAAATAADPAAADAHANVNPVTTPALVSVNA